MGFWVKGKITIKDKTNANIQNDELQVEIWDYDPNKRHDLMATTRPNHLGQFAVAFATTNWDKALSKKRRKADVFVVVKYWVSGNSSTKGFWAKLYQSKVKFNVDEDVQIHPRITISSEKHMTKFKPSKDGWRFINSFNYKLPVLKKSVGLGFCGGMVLMALKYFNKAKSINTRKDVPKQGGKLFKLLLDAQLKSFGKNGRTITKVIDWINRPDIGHTLTRKSLGYLTKKELGKVKAKIKEKELVPIVLVRREGLLDTLNASDSHQVLVYGFTFQNAIQKTELFIYDPNNPSKDDVKLTIYQGFFRNRIRMIHSHQSKLRERGFFINNIDLAKIKLP